MIRLYSHSQRWYHNYQSTECIRSGLQERSLNGKKIAWTFELKFRAFLHFIPLPPQPPVIPLPVYPAEHWHKNDPSVFRHSPFTSQLCEKPVHSFKSVAKKKWERRGLCEWCLQWRETTSRHELAGRPTVNQRHIHRKQKFFNPATHKEGFNKVWTQSQNLVHRSTHTCIW